MLGSEKLQAHELMEVHLYKGYAHAEIDQRVANRAAHDLEDSAAGARLRARPEPAVVADPPLAGARGEVDVE